MSAAAPTSDAALHPYTIRKGLRFFTFKGVPGYERAAGKLNRHQHGTAKGILRLLLDECDRETAAVTLTVEDIAEDQGLSTRTIGKKLEGLADLGLIRRIRTGPAPWTTVIDLQYLRGLVEAEREARVARRVQRDREVEAARRRRVAAELAAMKERREREDLAPDFGEGADELPGEDAGDELLEGDAGDELLESDAGDELLEGDAGDELLEGGGRDPEEHPERPIRPNRAARRRALSRAKPGQRTSPQLASLLWNLSPLRSEYAEGAKADTRWPDVVLERTPDEIWAAICTYHRCTLTGSATWAAGAQSLKDFAHRHIWPSLQWAFDSAEEEPGLGRKLRPNRALYESGARQWAPPALPEVDHTHPRAAVLPDWLRARYNRGTFCEDLYELLRQRGPPPDWLPDELQARWGDLPLPFLFPL